MSDIDERIVQMTFDNKQFEKGASETLGTLDKLKQALRFDDASKGISSVAKSIKDVTFDSLENNVQKISDKFSALGIIGVTALQKITNQAIDTGEKLVKSLSIDQITAGWKKYNEETANVQTIMNATGKSQKEVYEYLKKILWYSDQTSYGYTDMTSALATMTSTGGDIEKLIPLLEGVANATAFAGKGAKEYSRIMQYAITQSYSNGALTYMDWKTIQNAGAGSKQLQAELIKAGEELGTIQKGMVKVDQFAKSIRADGAKELGVDYRWVTTDVMEKAFGNFAKYTDAVYEASEITGEYEDVYEAMDKLADKYSDISVKAFKSAQQAKTFEEAIDATKDAVSTGWSTTFKTIFGEFDDAVERWTELCEELWVIFAKTGEYRNEILSSWDEQGGDEAFWQGIINILHAIQNILEPIREAFYEVFNFSSVDEGANTLLKISEGFKNFTEKLILTEDKMQDIKNIFETVFSVIKIGIDLIGGGIKIIAGVAKSIYSVIETPLNVALDGIKNWIDGIKLSVENGKIFTSSIDTIKTKFDSISEIIRDKASSIKKNIEEAFNSEKNFSIITALDVIKNAFSKVYTFIQSVCTKIKNAFLELSESFSKFISDFDLNEAFNNLLKGGVIASLIGLIKTLSTELKNLSLSDTFENAKGAISEFKDTLTTGREAISGVLDEVKNSLKAWQTEIKANIILKIAGSLGILSLSLVALSDIDIDSLSASFTSISMLLGELVGAAAILSKLQLLTSFKIDKSGFTNFSDASVMLLKLTASLLIVSKAMKNIGDLGLDKMGASFVAITLLIGELVGTAAILSKMKNDDLAKSTGGLIAFSLALMEISRAVAVIGNLDLKEAITGIVGISALLWELVGVVAALPTDDKLLKTCTGLIAFSVAIKILASAVNDIGGGDERETLKFVEGLSGITALLFELVAFVNLTKNSTKDMLAIGAGLMILSVGIKIIASAINDISDLDPNQLIASIGAISSLLMILGLLTKAMDSVDSGLKGAASITLMATAILGIAAALKIVGSMDYGKIGASLGALTIAIGAFVGAAYLLSPIGPILLLIAGAFDLFAVGLIATSAALLILGPALSGIAVGFTAMGGAIVAVVGSVILALRTLAYGIPAIISDFVSGIIDGAFNISNSFVSGMGKIMETVATIFVTVSNIVATGIANVMNTISTAVANAITTIGNIDGETYKQGLEGLAMGIGLFVAAGLLLLPVIPILAAFSAVLLIFGAALETIAISCAIAGAGLLILIEYFPVLKDILSDFGEKVQEVVDKIKDKIHEVIEKIKEYLNDIKEFFSNISESIKTFFENLAEKAKYYGKKIIEGLWNGLKSGMSIVTNGVKNLAKSIKSSFTKELGIHSPSKVFADYGKNIDSGLEKGIEDGSKGTEDTFSKMISNILTNIDISDSDDEFYSIGEKLGESLSTGIKDGTANTTIEPVIDMDAVKAQYGTSNLKSSYDEMTPAQRRKYLNSLEAGSKERSDFLDLMVKNSDSKIGVDWTKYDYGWEEDHENIKEITDYVKKIGYSYDKKSSEDSKFKTAYNVISSMETEGAQLYGFNKMKSMSSDEYATKVMGYDLKSLDSEEREAIDRSYYTYLADAEKQTSETNLEASKTNDISSKENAKTSALNLEASNRNKETAASSLASSANNLVASAANTVSAAANTVASGANLASATANTVAATTSLAAANLFAATSAGLISSLALSIAAFNKVINGNKNLDDIESNKSKETKQHVTFDTLFVKGVNDKDEFVASADYSVGEIISSLLRKESRV